MTADSDPINVLLFPELVINMGCGEPLKQEVLSPLGSCTQVKALIINIGTPLSSARLLRADTRTGRSECLRKLNFKYFPVLRFCSFLGPFCPSGSKSHHMKFCGAE